MFCRITDLRCKDVINVRNGVRLGFVSDVEVDTCTARVVALVIYGRCKWFGLFGRVDDLIIKWCDIEVIGEDTILVNCCNPNLNCNCGTSGGNCSTKGNFFCNLFK